MAEHGVRFSQVREALLMRFDRNACRARHLRYLIFLMGQKLVQRRVEQTDRYGQAPS